MMRIGKVGPMLALGFLCQAALGVETVILRANLVDLSAGEVRPNQGLRIESGRIVWVGPSAKLDDLSDTEVIDANGAYLLPGLIDAHVHLSDPLEYPLYLAAGVTTIVELGGPDHRDWRRELEEGSVPGPRLVTCGPIVTAQSAAGAHARVSAHARAGYDCFKLYDDMPAEVFAALARSGRELGIPSAAHIPRNLTWDDMLTAAPAAVAHAEEFLYSPCCSEVEFARIAKTMRERNIALITTLTTYDNITQQASDLDWFLARQPSAYYPGAKFRAWKAPLNRYGKFGRERAIKMRALFRFQQWLIKYLHEAGVSIVMGTDAGNTGTFPGPSAAEELRWLVASGLSAQEALLSATGRAAAFLGQTGRIGTIEPGAGADLLLLAANPLADISNVRFVRGVMVRGRWFDADALEALRAQVRRDLALEHRFVARLDRDGVESALAWLSGQSHGLRLGALNELGYQKLEIEGSPGDAVRLFRANVGQHSENWVAHASLAEGLLALDDRSGAQAAAARVLALAPDNAAARRELESLGLLSQ